MYLSILAYPHHAGLLDIYQELLGLKFSEVKDAEAWSADVQLVRSTTICHSLFE